MFRVGQKILQVTSLRANWKSQMLYQTCLSAPISASYLLLICLFLEISSPWIQEILSDLITTIFLLPRIMQAHD